MHARPRWSPVCRWPLFLFALATAVSAAEVHVAPGGDDRNPGTAARPVRTLSHARDLVRALNAARPDDAAIVLHGGTYRLAAPLVLTPQDSGRDGHCVTYRAAPGEHPIVSGAVAVTGWTQVDAAKNVWAAPAPAALVNTRQLYVNGIRAPRTHARVPVALTQTRDGYDAASPALASWRNPSDIEFVYTGGNALWSEPSVALGPWTEPRCPIGAIQGHHIVMAQPAWDNCTRRVMLPPGRFKRAANLVGPTSIGKQPTYVENAFELLGTPGEWYFDRTNRMIYYVPRPGEELAKADVEAPVLEALIVGESTPEDPIHDLVFEGIQFSYATWLFPSTPEGFPEIQANYLVTGTEGYAKQGLGDLVPGGTHPFGAWTKTPGNVRFAYNHNLVFRRDVFAHLGGAGLDLGNGSQSDLVEGNIFTDISANGVELGGVDQPLATGAGITRDNVIRDNHIYAVAIEFHGGIGICVGYAQRTRIEHNQLDHLPYSGISMGWGGWPDKIEQAGVANYSRDNVVSDNLIFKHMLLLADGAAIYTQGLTGPSLAEGEKIDGNVIYDQYGSGHGIYTDNGCKNVTAVGNVIFHTNHDNWGSRHKDYYDGQHGENYDAFAFADNYWQQGDPDVAAKNVALKGNHLISALNDAPATILQSAGLEPAYRGLLEAPVAPPAAPEPPSRVAAEIASGGALVTWNPSVFEGGAAVTSYTVSASTGAKATIAADEFGKLGYVRFDKIATDQPCTFTVTAANAQGASAASLPSRPAKPSAKPAHKPDAPTNVEILASDGRASVHFQAPASDGGAPITAYVFTVNPGGRRVTFTGRQVLTLGGRHTTFGVVDGLEPGKSYGIAVSAVNAAGDGSPAEKSFLAR